MLLSHTLTLTCMRRSDVARLVEIRPMVLLRDSVTDRWTNDGCTDARNNNVALAHPCYEGKQCSKFGKTPTNGFGG